VADEVAALKRTVVDLGAELSALREELRALKQSLGA
jgi:hypothetical protein